MLLAGVLGLNGKASALDDTNSMQFTVEVPQTISITLPSTSPVITYEEIEGGGSFGTAAFTVNVGINVPLKYTLSMYASTSGTTSASDLKSGSNTIPALTSAQSVTNLSTGAGWESVNRWGYAVGTTASVESPLVFNGVGVSGSATTLHSASGTGAVSNADPTNVILGTKIDLTQPSGSYSTTLNFLAVANVAYTYTLSYDANGGTLSGTSLPATATVEDSSSSHSFTVTSAITSDNLTSTAGTFLGWSTNPNAETADYEAGDSVELSVSSGEYSASATLYAVYGTTSLCGSTQTMQGITSSVISGLTTNTQVQMCDERDGNLYWVAKLADGNVWMTQNLDFVISTSGTELKTTDSNVSSNKTLTATNGWDYEDISFYEGGNNYLSGGFGGSFTSADSLATNSENWHYHQGNYYNWTAATAGSGTSSVISTDATESICPAGWRLPTSNSTTANYSFGKLTAAYSISSSSAGATALTSSPLYFVPGGYVYSGSLSSAGGYGYYWSSMAYSNTSYAYDLFFYSSGVLPSGNFVDRYGGFTVRCVAI